MKLCHIKTNQIGFSKNDLINLLLQNFRSQKSLKQHFFSLKKEDNPNQNQYLNLCKKILGKCFKLKSVVRDVFLRILTLYTLSESHRFDQKEGGQKYL
jgi:hypothetical protein